MSTIHINKRSAIITLTSNATRSEDAFREIAGKISREDTAFVLLFLPDRVIGNDDQIAVSKHLGHLTVFGCTTAGQITSKGYESDSFLALVFPKNHFRIASLLIPNLVPFSLSTCIDEIELTARNFRRSAHWNRLALLITDGLSKQEDILIASISASLRDTQVFGGSAADGQRFSVTQIIAGGEFHTNAALLMFIETDLDFELICFDHFAPTERKVVITKARPNERIVMEINGAPAAEEYARITGVSIDALSPKIFAENPLLVQNHGKYHVRSIQQITSEGGLAFLCAIDEGLIMTLGAGQEIVRTLENELSNFQTQGRNPDFILAFDCFLRRLEIDNHCSTDRASEILMQHHVYGFNTYGEQHNGLHVNQTFVGVAFFLNDARSQYD